MLISHPQKFIFIHVYKNAGSSIGRALLPFAYPRTYRVLNPIARRLGANRFNPIPCGEHASAAEIKVAVGEETFNSYFKFAVVRNPWDWQLSLFTFMRKDPNHHQHEFGKSLASFDDYLKWRCEQDFHSQSEFITSPSGTLMTDRLLRFESLDEDFKSLCSELGLKCELPHVNKSKTAGYQEAYSDFGRDLVASTFAEDIERFQYSFGGSAIS